MRGDWVAIGIGQRRGVSDGAVFVHSRCGGQGHRGGVVDVADDGADRSRVWRDGFQITASGRADAFGDGGRALVHIVAHSNIEHARACARSDGDGFTAVQGHGDRTILRGDWVAVGVGQGRGVSDRAVFVHSRCRGQGHRGGVVDVADDGADRSRVRCDGFQVAAGCRGNRLSHRRRTLVHIIADGHIQYTRACARSDSDGLAAVQGHGHRTVLRGDGVAVGIGQGRGVGDGAVFIHGRRSSQRYGGGVVDIADDGADWRRVRRDGFQVAAGGSTDAFGDGGRTLVNIVANRDIQYTRACARGDGDGLAAVERDSDRTILRGDWVAIGIGQRRGVSDGAVFVHCRCGSERHGGGVVDIADDGADWRRVRCDGFQITAGGSTDAFGDGGWALVDVVADGYVQYTRACARGDGDGLAAVQGYGDRAVLRGDRVAVGVGQRGGVGDGAVFVHGRSSSQRHGGGVVDVADDGADRSGVWRDGFEVAAGCRGNRLSHRRRTLIHVVADGYVQYTRACARRDGDGFAAVQSHGDWTVLRGDRVAVGISQRGGVSDGAVFIHGRSSSQRHGGGVVDVADDGADRSRVRCDGFQVTAGCRSNRLSHRRRTLIHVITNGHVQHARARARGDGDRFAAVQGHSDRTILRGDRVAIGIGQRRGVSDGAVFVHGRRGGQGHRGGVVDIADDGADRSGVWGDGFQVAAGCRGNRLGHGGWALIDVIADSHVQYARACARGDGDGFTAVERDGDWTVLRGDRVAIGVGQGRGVGDGAVFVHGRCGGQGHGGGVVDITDDGADRSRVRRDGFQVATRGGTDAFGDGGRTLVDVVADGYVQYTRACARSDGDGFAAVQSHGDWTVLRSDRVAVGIGQGGGVSDRAVFVHGWRGGQRHGSGVIDVADDGAGRRGVWRDGFQITASGRADAFADGRWTLVHVIADRDIQYARTCASGDGDGFAAVQGHSDRTVLRGDRIAVGIGQGRGVGDGAVFVHGWRGGQRHGSGVIDVADDGAGRRGVWRDGFQITASGRADAFADGRWALVHVITNGHVQHARARARGNGDGLAAVQSHGNRTILRGDRVAIGIGQRGGVSDGAVFVHGRCGGQRYGSSVVDVADDGADWRRVRSDGFQIAAGCRSNRLSHRRRTLIHVVADSHVQYTRACARSDGNGFAAVERNGDWTILRGDRVAIGVGQGRGVGDGAVFVHGRRSGQGHRGGVVDVADHGADWSRIWSNGFQVTARGGTDAFGDGGRTLVHIVANRDIQYTRARACGDGDGFTAVQGHGNRTVLRSDRVAVGIGQGGGVGDGAVFVHGRCGGQGHRGGVVDVADDGADRSGVRGDGFEVATRCRSNRLSHRRWPLVHVVANGHVQHARACAGCDGDGFAAVERDRHRTILRGDRVAIGVGQRGGVSDGAVFVYGRRGGQRHGGGVVDIADDSADRRGVGCDGFQVAAGCRRNRLSHRRRTLVHIIADGYIEHTRACACGDGDGLAAVERNGDRTILRGDWIAIGIGQRGGVSDGAVFVHGRCGGQRYGSGVVDIADDSADWRGVWCDGFQVATGCRGNRFGNRRWPLVNVVANRDIQYARACACSDGDGFAAVQSHGDRTVLRSDRVAVGIGQGRGVSDGAVFVHCRRGGQGHRGGVVDVADDSADRRGVWRDGFQITASGRADAFGDGGRALVHVVADGYVQYIRACACGDGDGLAAFQSHGDRTILRSDRIAVGIGQRGGVSDGAVFVHGWRSGQGHRGGVYRISNRGNRRRRARHQILKVTARRTSNGGADRTAIVVDVVGWRFDVNGASSLASSDGDDRAIAQGHGHRSLGRVGQGGGVGDLAAFGHGVARRQRDGGGVDGVGDLGHGRRGGYGHGNASATGGASDGHTDLAWVVVDRVIRREWNVDATGQLPRRDHDDRAVGQGHGQGGLRGLGHGRGVDQHAAGFGQGWRGAQGHRRIEHGVGGRIGRGIATQDVVIGGGSRSEAFSWETDSRVDATSGGIQHHEAVAATGGTPRARGSGAGGGGFQGGRRVDARGDGLLQLFYRRRGLGSGLCQVGGRVRGIGAPLGVAAQVQSAAIGQIQCDGAGRASVQLVARVQAITFNEYASDAFWGYDENLTNNAFDNGNNTAH
ncbi:hypothetical protein BSG18_35160 [Pseudomonas ogarae]|nr:hypothetical protein BSG18_35160 [Pseudomonas ogarae]